MTLILRFEYLSSYQPLLAIQFFCIIITVVAIFYTLYNPYVISTLQVGNKMIVQSNGKYHKYWNEIFRCNEEKKEMAVSIPTSTIDQVNIITIIKMFTITIAIVIFTNPDFSWSPSPSWTSPPPSTSSLSAWSRRNHSERRKLSSESCRGRLVIS